MRRGVIPVGEETDYFIVEQLCGDIDSTVRYKCFYDNAKLGRSREQDYPIKGITATTLYNKPGTSSSEYMGAIKKEKEDN